MAALLLAAGGHLFGCTQSPEINWQSIRSGIPNLEMQRENEGKEK